MLIKEGNLYFKTPDVRAFTGLSQGQINNARRRGDLDTVQFVDGGDCYFKPEVIIGIQKEIREHQKFGTGRRLRRKPVIKDKPAYRKIAKHLRRYGYDNVPTLDQLESGDLLAATKDSEPEASKPEPESAPESEPKLKPDTLPFLFKVGSAELPNIPDVGEEFELVKDLCFGHFDETHEQCRDRCDFAKTCAYARFQSLTAIAKGLEEEKSDDQINEEGAKVLQSERARVANAATA
jgi:hypothetical protein